MAVESNLKSGDDDDDDDEFFDPSNDGDDDDDDDDDDDFHDCQDGWTWCQPEAMFPGSDARAKEVEDFLHANKESYTFKGFKNFSHAKNWSLKYFGGGPGTGYHAIATNVGVAIGGGGYVKVTKVMAEEDEDELGE